MVLSIKISRNQNVDQKSATKGRDYRVELLLTL